MAQALAFVLPGVFGAGGSVALFATTGVGAALTTTLTTAGIVANVVGSLALNAVSSALFKPDAPQVGPDSLKINTAGEVQPRMVHYGRVRVGYAIVFVRARSGKLYQVLVHGHGQCDGIDRYYVDKKQLTLNESGGATEGHFMYDGRSLMQIITRFGSVPQAAFSELRAVFPEWSLAHRLDGLTCSLMVAELPDASSINAYYPNREPTLEVELRGKVVLDPRTGEVGFTDNLALCALDYETSSDGGGLAGLVDEASFIAAADICDQQVPLAAGGSESRYRFSGSYSLDEEPAEIRNRFLGACAGEHFLTPEGKLGLRVGVYREPEFTITEDMVMNVEWAFGSDAVRSYTVAAFEYVDPALGYTRASGDAWRDEDRIDTLGEITSAPFISAPSHRQCRAVSKMMMMRDNPAHEVTLACLPMALEGFYEPTVRVDVPSMGLSGVFRVAQVGVDPETLVVSYALEVIDPAAYILDLDEQGNAPTFEGADDDAGVPAVSGFNAAAQGIQTSQNSYAAGIGVAWSARPYDSLTPVVEYAVAGSGEWQAVTVSADATAVQISGLADGSAYDIRMAWKAAGDALGAYAFEAGVVAQAVTGSPAAATGLAVSDLGLGVARVSWTSSSSAGLWKSELWRDGVLVATIPNEASVAVSVDDSSGAGSFSWVVRSVNVSGLSSDTAAISQTIA